MNILIIFQKEVETNLAPIIFVPGYITNIIVM